MPELDADFLCLRCGHSNEGRYNADEPQERTCPKCRSNSVRPIPRKPKPKPAAAAAARAG